MTSKKNGAFFFITSLPRRVFGGAHRSEPQRVEYFNDRRFFDADPFAESQGKGRGEFYGNFLSWRMGSHLRIRGL